MNKQVYTLQQLGWTSFYSNQIDLTTTPDTIKPGRITAAAHSLYTVLTDSGEYQAELTGKYHYAIKTGEAEVPAVGDWVLIETLHEYKAIIKQLLNRKSALYRVASGKTSQKQVLASNMDFIFIVSGLDHDFNIRRLERYVTMGWESGAEPVILLNKSDLISPEELDAVRYQVEQIAPCVNVHMISALNNSGLSELAEYIGPGLTISLIGSSGCGKSTLANSLTGRSIQKTNSVRAHDGRGRHTTVTRDLIVLESGGIIIDNPGLREIQLYADEEALDMTFSDVEAFASQCKFTNCTHRAEPGCKVQQALLDGELAANRYASYVKLQKEIAFQNKRVKGKKDPKMVEISKFVKQMKKHGKNPGSY